MRHYFNYRALLATSVLLISGATTTAFAQTETLADVARPANGGSWAQVYGSPMTSYALLGPQQATGNPEIKGNTATVYVDKTLNAQLGSISADGVEVRSSQLDNAGLSRSLSELNGKTVTLETLNTMAQSLKEATSAKGCFCNVFVRLEGSTLVFDVKEVTYRNITIEDGQHFSKKAVGYRLQAKAGKTVNLNTLKRNVHEITDNPDLQLETVLEPVEFSNEADLKLKIVDTRPIHGDVYWNNTNMDLFHRDVYGVNVIHNNVTGIGDSAFVGIVANPRTPGVFTRYEAPINSRGTRVGLEAS